MALFGLIYTVQNMQERGPRGQLEHNQSNCTSMINHSGTFHSNYGPDFPAVFPFVRIFPVVLVHSHTTAQLQLSDSSLHQRKLPPHSVRHLDHIKLQLIQGLHPLACHPLSGQHHGNRVATGEPVEQRMSCKLRIYASFQGPVEEHPAQKQTCPTFL